MADIAEIEGQRGGPPPMLPLEQLVHTLHAFGASWFCFICVYRMFKEHGVAVQKKLQVDAVWFDFLILSCSSRQQLFQLIRSFMVAVSTWKEYGLAIKAGTNLAVSLQKN